MWLVPSSKLIVVETQSDWRKRNFLSMLLTIMNYGELTKAEVQKSTVLSWSLVSQGVNYLERARFVKSMPDKREKTGAGRNAFVYTTDSYYYSIGVSLKDDRICVTAANLKKETLYTDQIKLEKITENEYFSRLFDLLDTVTQKFINLSLVGIGVSFTGSLDVKKGKLLSFPNHPDWTEYYLSNELMERYKKPVQIESEAVCALFNKFVNQNLEDCLLVFLDDEVSISILTGDVISMSGDRFHLDQCSVDIGEGNKALEYYCSLKGIHSRFGKTISKETWNTIYKECGEALGKVLYNASLLYGAKMIFFAGKLGGKFPEFKQNLEETLLSQGKYKIGLYPTGIETVSYSAALVGFDKGLLNAITL